MIRALLIIFGLIVASIAVAFVIAMVKPNTSTLPHEEPNTSLASAQTVKLLSFDEVKQGAIPVRLEIEGRGVMTLELYPKAAPKTVAHIVELCKRHFYKGMLVHRVEKNFVFQTGDPNSKAIAPAKLRGKTTEQVSSEFNLGSGGSGKTVPLEARLANVAGTIGLARSEAEDSGDSQFYVNLKDNKSLDGQYCVFGRVISGQDIAATVQIGDRITNMSLQ